MLTQAAYAWIPSTARVIRLDGFGPVPRGTIQQLPALLSWPVKDPADVLDYVFDISAVLAGNDGDAIATLDVAISPNAVGDLTVQSSKADGEQAIIWLAQGFAGTTYAVTITLTTNSGRAIARTVSLPVMNLATPAVSTMALTDQHGAPLTDQSGGIITAN